MAVVDQKRQLDAVDWRAREAFLVLGKRFHAATGLILKVRSGRRTCGEQADLYGIGRTYNLTSKPVTYARGCQSWHVLGRAIDADPAGPDGRVTAATQSCANATIAGQLWESMGGVWGGRFGGFGGCGDQGHFEWHPGFGLATACPDPDRCDEAAFAIATQKPRASWLWGVGAAAVVLAGGVYWTRRSKK